VLDKWRGKWSLVTGASAGIGLELAKILAQHGANLVLTARRTDRLQQLASELASKHGVKTEVLSVDLTRLEGPGEIFAATSQKGIEIDLLVNNAGFGAFGNAWEIPAEKMTEMIQVNCSAVVHLTRLYMPPMIARRRGDILIVASVAGFQPVPYNSVYAATKAFDFLFSMGVAEEARGTGVNVCALCPGSTETEFQKVAEQPDRMLRSAETAEKVARVGLEALAAGKPYVISGFKNKLMTEAQRIAPRGVVVRAAAKMMRPQMK
jgi:uncharacterized protein